MDNRTCQGGVAASRQGKIAAGCDAGLRGVQIAVDKGEISTEIALVGATIPTATTGLKTDAKLVLGVLNSGDGQLAADIDIRIVASDDLRIRQAGIAAGRQVQVVAEGKACLRPGGC